MKKILAIILAVSMVFSMMLINVSAFEAETVETAAEAASGEVAVDLTAYKVTGTLDTSSFGVLLLDLDFENTTFPTTGGSVSQNGFIGYYTTKSTNFPSVFNASTTGYRIQMPKAAEDYVTMGGSKVLPVEPSQQQYRMGRQRKLPGRNIYLRCRLCKEEHQRRHRRNYFENSSERRQNDGRSDKSVHRNGYLRSYPHHYRNRDGRYL